MNELGIIFQYHLNDAVTNRNLEVLRRSNPGVPIVLINVQDDDGQSIPGSIKAVDCGPLGQRWSKYSAGQDRWRNCDMPFLAWYSSTLRTISCRRWILLEYDVYCSMSLLDFIKPTLHADVVAPTIPMQSREPTWNWFDEIPRFPLKMRPFACGLVPLVTTILSDAAISKIARFYLDNEIDAFCEIRLGTVAAYVGFTSVPNSHPAARNISWCGSPKITDEQSIWHPVKTI